MTKEGFYTMSAYSSKARVEAAFNREFTDRVPARVWYAIGEGGEMPGVTRKEIRTEGDKYARYVLWVQERIPSDTISIAAFDIVMAAEFAGDGLGISIKEIIDLARTGKSLLADKSLFEKFQMADLMKGQRLPYYVEACQKVVEQASDIMLDVIVTGPWTVATYLRGEVDLIYDTRDDPRFVQDLLRFATEYTKAVGLQIARAGAGMITLGDPSSGCSVISPKMFNQWSKPYLMEAVEFLKENTESKICLHVCGKVDDIMEDLVTTGVEGISIDGPSSLERMIEINRDRTVVIGNIPTEMFLEGTKEQLEEQVRHCIDTAKESSCYILSSGCSVPGTEENIVHTLEYAREYGRRS